MNFKNKICRREKLQMRQARTLWCEVANMPIVLSQHRNVRTPTLAC